MNTERHINSASVYVINGVQRTLSESDVARHFEQYGCVHSFHLRRNSCGKSYGYGWLAIDGSASLRQKGVSWSEVVDGVELRVSKSAAGVSLIERARACTSSAHSDATAPTESGPETDCGRSDATSSLPSELDCKRSRADNCDELGDDEGADMALTCRPVQLGHPSHYYACVPIDLCPAAYANDPRACFARLDPHSLGTLYFTQKPSSYVKQRQQCNMYFWEGAHARSDRHAYSSDTVPPPPGPPPRHMTKS